MPLDSKQIENALIPYKEHPLVIFKPKLTLPLISTPSQQDSLRKSQQIGYIKEGLIQAARAVRVVSFGARAIFVSIGGAVIFYEKFKAEEAPEIVKDFCYKEAGRRNFKIKTHQGGETSFSAMVNTLYVTNYPRFPDGYLEATLKKQLLLKNKQKKYLDDEKVWLQEKQAVESQMIQLKESIKLSPISCYFWEHEADLTYKLYKLEQRPSKKIKNEKAIQINSGRMNLFKGILDHEMGHLNHYDSLRLPIILGGSMVGMEYFWRHMRPRLESNFKMSTPLGSNMLKNEALLGARWMVKLAIPTALYTGAFFAARQLAKKTIEAQADANVRDDLGVLTEVEQYFRKRAEEEASDPTLIRSMFRFFDSHPTDESRANYFAHRVEELKTKQSASLSTTLKSGH